MPEPNLRIVVLGATRADKEYDEFSRDRKKTQKEVAQLNRELQRLERKTTANLNSIRGFSSGR